ncbi:hypothetical protein FXW07_10195 [Methanosarcina sp. DH1]|uniref:hypothetical protein n=1 Tax=Methanosarcina sp. DH1 TaxID=2605695 RepID=UPI001E2FE291|nr:hypothetical protein [Methanosarcina sp. DH1]MCC4766975.1 hypothetical protein [Methanosarcina sp. DH1]
MVFGKKVTTVAGSAVPDMFGVMMFRLYLREVFSFEDIKTWKSTVHPFYRI